MSAIPGIRHHGGVAQLGTEPEIIVGEETDTDEREELARLWKVICHDDPITTMEFVVELFTTVFRQPAGRAMELMLRVHESGSAVIGLWPESVARRKVDRSHALARAEGFPLTFSLEEDT
jgi:ATP-dependent Clp protease adaptor protein ClpS